MRTRHLQFVIICVLSFLLLLQTYLKQNYFNIQLRESKCDQLLQILNQSLVKGTNEAPAESGPKDVFWYPRPPGEFLPENLFSQANEKICSNKLESRILILIPSKSDNFLARLAVRLTWGDLSVYSFLAANYTFAFVVSTNFIVFDLLSQRQGECYATTSMRKVELILEFKFHSGSNFLSRLVRQVISVPFVVWINTSVAPRQLFCLLKVSLMGFYWSTFRCLAGLANKDCVSPSEDFMSDEGKTGNK